MQPDTTTNAPQTMVPEIMTADECRGWRVALNLSQEQAAQALDLNRRSIVRMETGELSPSRAIRLAMAALALGITDFPSRLATTPPPRSITRQLADPAPVPPHGPGRPPKHPAAD